MTGSGPSRPAAAAQRAGLARILCAEAEAGGEDLVYFRLALLFGVGVLAFYGDVRVFRALGVTDIHPILDAVVTGLVLVGGSDLVAKVMGITGLASAEASAPRPIEVTGRLVLDDRSRGPVHS